jgi:hypothetical protein
MTNTEIADLMLRCKVLEDIALECFTELCAPLDSETCKKRLEAAIQLGIDSHIKEN